MNIDYWLGKIETIFQICWYILLNQEFSTLMEKTDYLEEKSPYFMKG